MDFKLVRCEVGALEMMPSVTDITSYAIVSFVIYSGATFRTHTGHGMSLGEVGLEGGRGGILQSKFQQESAFLAT